MPERVPHFGQHLLPLDVPAWLARAVAPWRIEAAALWRSGVKLDLVSERARVPVLIAADGVRLLDPRIPERASAALREALAARLRAIAAPRGAHGPTELRDWWRRVRALVALLRAGDAVVHDDALAALVAAFRAWPDHDPDPRDAIEALPAATHAIAPTLPRAGRAAIALHRFARGEVLEGLAAHDALPEAHGPRGLVEQLVDAVALGVLGRRREALEALSRASEAADGPEAWLAIARGFEALDAREAAIAAHERVVAIRGLDWDRLRLARVRGEWPVGEPAPRPRGDAPPHEKASFVRELVKALEGAGRHDDALAALGALVDDLGGEAPADLVVRAAELHLHRLEAAEARARLSLVADDRERARVRVIRGALVVLEGRPERALGILDGPDAPDAPDDVEDVSLERLAWTAEAHLALGRPERALERVERHLLIENTLVAYLLVLLCRAQIDPPTKLRSALDAPTFLDAFVHDVLPTLRSPERIAEEPPRALAAAVRRNLDDMGGNRGPRPTWLRRGPDGARRLEPVRARRSGREAAVENLLRVRTEPAETVLAAFAEVASEYPRSPHPFTYRGELLIWLGRYREALACFDEADARAPTRWSYVGRAAAYDRLGEGERADGWTRDGAARFGEVASATTHVYRGERLREAGAWDEARADLETALAHKPRRIGARVNLASACRALGDTAGFDAQIARLRADAPAFVWEAGGRADRPIDEATLRAMLDLMVGNRSSFLHTMIDRSGELRVIPDPARFVAWARLCLALARDELGREIAARFLA